MTRDYVFDLDTGTGGTAPAILSIYGGKITTYRRLAEHAMQKLAPVLGNKAPDWTASATLPGGDMADGDYDRFLGDLRAEFDWLPQPLLERLARCYGTAIRTVLGTATSVAQLGQQVAPNLYEAELHYLIANEWACDADDVLWRRTKLGLGMQPDQIDAVHHWFATQARLGQAAQ